MYLGIRRPSRRKADALKALMGIMGAIALCTLVGSVHGFVKAARSFKPFGSGSPH